MIGCLVVFACHESAWTQIPHRSSTPFPLSYFLLPYYPFELQEGTHHVLENVVNNFGRNNVISPHLLVVHKQVDAHERLTLRLKIAHARYQGLVQLVVELAATEPRTGLACGRTR